VPAKNSEERESEATVFQTAAFIKFGWKAGRFRNDPSPACPSLGDRDEDAVPASQGHLRAIQVEGIPDG
jgi:hypothetical protein